MRFAIGLICIILMASCGSNGNKTDAPADVPVATTSNAEELFKSKCYQCHRCDMDITGPALEGSFDRWSDKKLLFDFVRNSQEVIKTNVYAQGLYKKYNQTFMNPFPELSDADITAILNYCK